MNAVAALFKMAAKLGPVAITYFVIICFLFTDGFHGEFVIALLFLGTLVCWIVAFFAGCFFFGPVMLWYRYHKTESDQIAIFEKVLPVYVFIFGILAASTFYFPDTDRTTPCLGVSTYLSAITGWYLLTKDYFKPNY